MSIDHPVCLNFLLLHAFITPMLILMDPVCITLHQAGSSGLEYIFQFDSLYLYLILTNYPLSKDNSVLIPKILVSSTKVNRARCKPFAHIMVPHICNHTR